MKRRWPLVLLAAVLILLCIAVVVTLLSARSLEGAVPGRAPLLGLAVGQGLYLAASETGLFVSSDGRRWSRPAVFAGRPALVAGLDGQKAVVLSGGRLFRTDGPGRFTEFLPGRISGTAMASSGGFVYIAEGSAAIRVISRDCLVSLLPEAGCTETGLARRLRLNAGPEEILTLDVVVEPPLFFAGGLRAGVWRSSSPEQRWRRVLQTAARAIMVDDGSPKRIFLGTAGGLLVSQDQGLSWAFTGLRQPVEALAQSGGVFFALAGDRLVYESFDGQSWKAVITK